MLTRPESLNVLLLKLFQKDPSLSAQEVMHFLDKQGKTFSRAAIYKELKYLTEQDVLLKHGQYYSIQMTWIIEQLHIFDRIFDTSSKNFELQMPEEGEEVSYSLQNLDRLDSLWSHVTFLIFEEECCNKLYEWIPHPWFYLVNQVRQSSFENALRIAGKKVYRCIGNETPLALAFSTNWQSAPFVQVSFSESPFKALQDRYIDVIGNTLIEVKLSQKTDKLVKNLFSTYSNLDEFIRETPENDLHENYRARFTISRKQKKVKQMQRKFDEYFA